MPPFILRRIDKFPEPQFSSLQKEVFADIQCYSPALEDSVREEKAGRAEPLPVEARTHAPIIRLGAYRDEALIGWSLGWFERGDVFYMANSGVVTAWRRQGVYGALLRSMLETVGAMGATTLRSQHSVLNNPVIIAKLRFGFHLSGMTVSAQLGALVEMTYHVSRPRQAIFCDRVVPFSAERTDAVSLGD